MQYITFRLADSLPVTVCHDLYERIDIFKKKHPKPRDCHTKSLYWKEFGPLEERYLNNGFGACWFKNPECRKLLEESIAHKDEIVYFVHCYVIMTNHVHILIQPLGEKKTEDIMHSIKSFSANKINKLLGRRGTFWMKEYFDRMVRGEEDHKRHFNYILANPRFLPDGWFTLYVKES